MEKLYHKKGGGCQVSEKQAGFWSPKSSLFFIFSLKFLSVIPAKAGI